MSSKKRVFIVGADGADPKFLARLMSEGKLPHFADLCARGVWGPLQTTFPPVSPVAWTTCLTGKQPAEHGIRDFITKADDSYLPTIALFDVRGGAGGLPVYASRRTAPTLGETLTQAGKTSYILKVPGTFPPESIRGGVLAGFGMPDMVGSFGVSAWYTTGVAQKKASVPEGGDLVHPLEPVGSGVWSGEIPGPAKERRRFVVYRDGDRISLALESSSGLADARLAPGEWSGWIRVPFDGSAPGLCRFKLVSLGQGVELYRTAVQCAPDEPLFPLAGPPGFGARLYELVGPFATIGMPSDLDGVRRGVVDLDTFLEDAYANWDQQIEMTRRLMVDPSWDLLMTHLFTIDNVQHLFWHCQDERHPAHADQARYGAEIERAYRWMDARLGRLLEGIDEQTTVIVLSDHGGVPIYRLVYLNAWLRERGYLVPREQDLPGRAIRLDWNRTRAAMFGTGGIWLNVQGRDPRGIVPPGAPYESLRHEIAQALSTWHDPDTGQPVVKEVLHGEQVFGDSARERGPDLIPALYPGYGLGRGEGLGRVMCGTPLIVDNLTPWSGGHEGPYLPSDVPGIGILCGPGVPPGASLQGAGLQDIAPTVLKLLDINAGTDMVGRTLC
ncbi:MAG: alkaline phosphatase family protein [Anaerolineae bacterium]|nr:alkaline phosphatase family protein [Anaerolineae bacterium]